MEKKHEAQEVEKLQLGHYHTLTIVKEVDFGLYLDGGDEGEILLPKRYVPETYKVGEALRVFLYLDQEERLIATTEQPLAEEGQFAYLSCSWVNAYGAFLNWGLMKDLFCPFREQKKRMEIGQAYIVYVTVDPDSYRLMATAKVERYFSQEKPTYQVGQEVEILVWQKTDLGFKVIVDNAYPGLVYRDQVFRPVQTGDRMKAYITQVRADGKLDVALQPTGRKQTLDFSDVLLQYLKEHDGVCYLGDKSDAEEIKRTFCVSKKVFKRAVGDLYKRRLIVLADDGIRLS